MTKWHGGKGSSPRTVNKTKFDENFDRIFNQGALKDGSEKTEDGREAEAGSNDADAEVCEAKAVRP